MITKTGTSAEITPIISVEAKLETIKVANIETKIKISIFERIKLFCLMLSSLFWTEAKQQFKQSKILDSAKLALDLAVEL